MFAGEQDDKVLNTISLWIPEPILAVAMRDYSAPDTILTVSVSNLVRIIGTYLLLQWQIPIQTNCHTKPKPVTTWRQLKQTKGKPKGGRGASVQPSAASSSGEQRQITKGSDIELTTEIEGEREEKEMLMNDIIEIETEDELVVPEEIRGKMFDLTSEVMSEDEDIVWLD